MQGERIVTQSQSSGRWPGAIIARETARHAVRPAAMWGTIFGFYVGLSAYGYASSYKTAAQRHFFAKTFGTDVGINAIIGPAHQIQTVAGFTAWRSLGVLSIVGAVWGLLAGTRLLRGEEEAGRWELLLAGQTTRRGAAVQALAGLAAGLLALWVIMAIVVTGVGRLPEVHIAPSSALLLAAAAVSGTAMFLAVGALASQLAPTRRQAASYAGGALGLAYATRMVADSGAGLEWLRWTTPLGWVEELQPLTSPHPLMFLPIAGLVGAFSCIAVYLAGGRDLGASTIADRPRTKAHLRLLSGPAALTARLVRPVLSGWLVAIALTGLMMGLISKSAGRALSDSSSFGQMISMLGAHKGGASTYLGVAFLVAAVMMAFVAAGQIGTARGEEASGRLDHLLARPIARWRWLGGRLTIIVGALVIVGLTAGLSAWIGSALQGAGVSLASMLAAGLNLVPPAVFLLGIGTLVFGVKPRAVSAVVYGILAWSFLIEIVGGIIRANHWLLDTSVLHQMAAAPAVNPDWTANAILVALGIASAFVGGFGFLHRDLVGD